MAVAELGMNSSSKIVGSEAPSSGCPFHNIEWGTMIEPRLNLFSAFTAIATIGSFLWIHHLSQRNRPGPKCWPIVGSVPVLAKNWNRLLDFLLEIFEEGYDSFKISFAFGVERTYVAEPSLIEYMLKTNFDNYPKGIAVTRYMEEILGTGIFNSDHEQWKTQRKVASYEFHSSNLRDFSSVVFKDHAVRLLQIISQFSQSNQSMDLQELFMRMTLDSTSTVGFGVQMGCLSPTLPAVPFAIAFERANELSFHRFVDPFWVFKRTMGVGVEKELRDCVKVMDSFSYDVIRRRREDKKNSENLTEVKTKSDLLSRFMSQKEGSKEVFSDQGLRDIISNFIIAGRDTTGLTLSWFMYNLCLHPEIEEKILEEIQTLEQQDDSSKEDKETGDDYTKFAELLTYHNLGKLNYLQAALSETLRLYPAVPVDGKTAAADDVLPNGAPVKKGSMLVYCSYALGRLERVWGPDAKEFKPERWLKNGTYQQESPFKFVSFHAGPRTCLGKESAYLQMKMTAALLVRFFRFQLVPGHGVNYRVMFVLTMIKGLQVTASPRK